MFLGYRSDFSAFIHPASDVQRHILIPKYYDPKIGVDSKKFMHYCDLVSVGALVSDKALALATGHEIGRMSYGTGDIPFVRTSDLATWELVREPKQGVSESVYAAWNDKQKAKAGDILLVRDGTYLVGCSILLCQNDLPLLFCGGIYKLRALRPETIDGGLLFALLNLPFVRRQLRNKQFTRDVIDTLGKRLNEVILPIPKDPDLRKFISSNVGGLVAKRASFRGDLQEALNTMYPDLRG